MASRLDAVILAAGEGSRAQNFTHEVPKSVFPLDRTGTCLLGRLLHQLSRDNVNRIFIVAGHQFESVQSWLKNYISHNLEIAQAVKIIDARPKCVHGPLHSFSSVIPLLKNSEHIVVFPGDTWFSDSFIGQICDICQLPDNYGKNLLFYSDLGENLTAGSYVLEKDPKNLSRVKKVLFWGSTPKIQSSKGNTGVILPVLAVNPTFIENVSQDKIAGVPTLIEFIMPRLTESGGFSAQAVRIVGPPFIDMDTFADYQKIKAMLHTP